MNELDIALTAIGGTVISLILVSNLIEEKGLSIPLAALLMGILMGPSCTGAVDLATWGSQEDVLEKSSSLILGLALAVFIAGVAFVVPDRSKGIDEEARFAETLSFFFTVPGFVLVGLALPWEGWLSLSWKGPLLAVSLVLLHRLPVMLALRPLIPS